MVAGDGKRAGGRGKLTYLLYDLVLTTVH